MSNRLLVVFVLLMGLVSVTEAQPNVAVVEIATLDHPENVDTAAWSTDGTHIISLTASPPTCERDCIHEARLWTAEGVLVAHMQHNAPLYWARVSLDNSRVLSSSQDGVLKLWDSDSRLLAEYDFGDRYENGGNWNSEGTRLLVWGDDTVFLLDADGNQLTQITHMNVQNAEWNRDGDRFYSLSYPVSEDGFVQVWTQTGDLMYELSHPDYRRIHTVIWSPDDRFIATATIYDGMAVWDAESGQFLAQFNYEYEYNFPSWMSDSTRLLTDSRSAFHLVSIEGHELASYTYGRSLTDTWNAVWNTDETRLLTWGALDTELYMWDVDGTLLTTMHHQTGLWNVYWSWDGEHILAVASDLPSGVCNNAIVCFSHVYIWNTDGSLRYIISQQSFIDGIFPAPNADAMFIAGNQIFSGLWTFHGDHIASIPHAGRDFEPIWHPDGVRFLTWSGNQVQIWQLSQ